MKTWLMRGIVIILVLGVISIAWGYLFPGPEKIIRKRTMEVAHLASFGPNEAPLAKLSNTQQLLSLFAPDVTVVMDVPNRHQFTLAGRQELQQALMPLRTQISSMTVEFLDVHVAVASDKNSASVSLTAKAQIGGDREPYIQELLITFGNVSGDWLLTRLETVKTLR